MLEIRGSKEKTKREYSLVKGTAILTFSFLVSLGTVAYVVSDYHKRMQMVRRIKLCLVEDPIAPDCLKEAVVSYLWKLLAQFLRSISGALIFWLMAVGASFRCRKMSRTQTWSNIMRLRWPLAGAFMIGAIACAMSSISAVLLVTNAIQIVIDALSATEKNRS